MLVIAQLAFIVGTALALAVLSPVVLGWVDRGDRLEAEFFEDLNR